MTIKVYTVAEMVAAEKAADAAGHAYALPYCSGAA